MANLSKYLTDAGMSQKEFADKIGVDKATVSRLVAEKMTPSLMLAAKIQAVTRGKVKAINWVGGSETRPSSAVRAASDSQGGRDE